VEAAKSPTNASRGKASRLRGAFPGFAEVFGQGPGKTELGMGGKDEPGPAVGGLWVAELGRSPSQGLLDHSEGVFKEQATVHT